MLKEFGDSEKLPVEESSKKVPGGWIHDAQHSSGFPTAVVLPRPFLWFPDATGRSLIRITLCGTTVRTNVEHISRAKDRCHEEFSGSEGNKQPCERITGILFCIKRRRFFLARNDGFCYGRSAMLTMNDLRQGATIIESSDPWIVVESDFMKKAQRRPVMRTKLRNLRTGQVIHKTYKQGDSIPEADITKSKAQYLYRDGEGYAFMDQGTYEQYTLSAEQVGDGAKFLRDGMEVDLIVFESAPVSIQLPIKVEVKILEAAPGIRGDSASNIMKEATIEGGVRIQVPLFIKEGDTVRIDTRTGEYVERAGQ